MTSWQLSKTALASLVLLTGVLAFLPRPAGADNPPTAILLHIGPVVGDNACGQVPASFNDIVTSAAADPHGSDSYYVYLLGTPVYPSNGNYGIAGMQLGITYDEDAPSHPALAVHSWNFCASGLYFPGDGWPGPDTGIILTWLLPDQCGQPPLAAAGYFYVTAYGSSVMAVEGYPADGKVRVADCNGTVFDVEVDPARVGWVSLGNAAMGNDTDGCNPALEPCLGPAPVESSTWGKVKARYVDRSRP